MINLAANDSSALRGLLRKINPPLDFVKVALERDLETQLSSARSLRPVLLHGCGDFWRIGMPELPNLERLQGWIKNSQTPYLSVHLDVQPEDLTHPTPGAALERIAENAQALRQATGLEVLLENVAHYAWSERPRFVTDPTWIKAALEISESGLLLDIAHARVSAQQRGECTEAYMAALPLTGVQEIHTSAPRMEQDGLRDRHLGMEQADFDWLEWVLTQTPNVQTITLEYGGIPDVGHTRTGQPIRIPRNDSSVLLENLAKLDTLRKRLSGKLRQAPRLPLGWHIDQRRPPTREEELSLASIRAMGY
jgi:uncharacterized protein